MGLTAVLERPSTLHAQMVATPSRPLPTDFLNINMILHNVSTTLGSGMANFNDQNSPSTSRDPDLRELTAFYNPPYTLHAGMIDTPPRPSTTGFLNINTILHNVSTTLGSGMANFNVLNGSSTSRDPDLSELMTLYDPPYTLHAEISETPPRPQTTIPYDTRPSNELL